MKLLAIETSSMACSVAMQNGDVMRDQHVVEAKAHTRILMPMIKALLDDAGLRVSDLDALVLGNGPGSFIGMRIGASVAQGLAFGAGLNIVPVSSLAAVATEVLHKNEGEYVAVAQDARMDQIYLGCFRRDEAGLPTPLAAECIHDIGEIKMISERQNQPWLSAGAGWQRYPSLAAQQSVELAEAPDALLPRARHLLGIARGVVESGQSVAPDELQPAYLRDRVAIPPDSR